MADHPIFAAIYDRLSQSVDAAGMEKRRGRLLSAATGRVLEIGAGTGLNFAHYRNVPEVVALEPDGAMRRRMLDRVALASVPVQVHEAGIDDAPFDDASFDTVVSTLVLCSVPDLSSALARIRRLLKPDGQLLFIEHVLGVGARGAIQRAVTPVWRHAAAGCRLDRDTPRALREAGFAVTDLERFRTSPLDPFTGTMVQGRAQPRLAA